MRIIETVLASVFGCFLGALGVVTWYDGIKGANPSFWSFTLFDFVHLITYATIGVYVAYHLRNRFSDQQTKKALFIEITSDIKKLFEQVMPDFGSFMKSSSNKQDGRNKVILGLRMISNKIHILEEHKPGFSRDISTLVEKIRDDYTKMKQIITGDDFATSVPFSDASMPDVCRHMANINHYLDEIKLRVFQ
jgi:hypothetical protein